MTTTAMTLPVFEFSWLPGTELRALQVLFSCLLNMVKYGKEVLLLSHFTDGETKVEEGRREMPQSP
jgi:pyridoxal/pyridoxine/pyridoxamine kinase